jgi:hypothetical protein
MWQSWKQRQRAYSRDSGSERTAEMMKIIAAGGIRKAGPRFLSGALRFDPTLRRISGSMCLRSVCTADMRADMLRGRSARATNELSTCRNGARVGETSASDRSRRDDLDYLSAMAPSGIPGSGSFWG